MIERIVNLITWFFVGVALAAVLLSISGCAAKPPMPPAVIDHEAVKAMSCTARTP